MEISPIVPRVVLPLRAVSVWMMVSSFFDSKRMLMPDVFLVAKPLRLSSRRPFRSMA